MKKRGVSILWALYLTALFFALGLAAAVRLDQARHIARNQTDHLRARSQAASGCRYARAQLATGRWKGSESFQSPDYDGFFRLQLTPLSAGRVSIRCQGKSGRIEYRQEDTYP